MIFVRIVAVMFDAGCCIRAKLKGDIMESIWRLILFGIASLI